MIHKPRTAPREIEPVRPAGPAGPQTTTVLEDEAHHVYNKARDSQQAEILRMLKQPRRPRVALLRWPTAQSLP